MSKYRSKDKSIIAKFTETMKGLADSAAEAFKAEERPVKGKSNARPSRQTSKQGKSVNGSKPRRARPSAKTNRASARTAEAAAARKNAKRPTRKAQRGTRSQ